MNGKCENRSVSSIGQLVGVIVFIALFCSYAHSDLSIADALQNAPYFRFLAIGFVLGAITFLLFLSRKYFVGPDVWLVSLFVVYVVFRGIWEDSLMSRECRMVLSGYFIYLFALSTRRFYRLYILFFVFTAFFESIKCMKQLYGFEMTNHHRFPVTGSFANPGPLGIYLSTLACVGVAALKKRVFEGPVKYVLYVMLVPVLLGITVSHSRAAWLGLLIGLAVLYREQIGETITGVCRRVRVPRWLFFVCVATVGIGLGVGLYMMKSGSAQGRLYIWRNMVSALVEKPLLGVGTGNFATAYARQQYDYSIAHDALFSHAPAIVNADVPEYPFNELLSVTLQWGVVALLLIGAIVFVKLRYEKANAFTYGLLTLFVSSLFSYPLQVAPIATFFCIAMGLGSSCLSCRVKRRIFVPVFGVLFSVYVYATQDCIAEKEAYKEWQVTRFLYQSKCYDDVAAESAKIAHVLSRNATFMFEYGHSLHFVGRYAESNRILQMGAKRSCDPMYWCVMGNNYMGMGMAEKAECAYLRAYYMCPSRIYPLYLLFKLSAKEGNVPKMRYYGKICLEKPVKISSSATESIKREVSRELMNF